MRKTGRPKGDDLVITLHVEILAGENLVSPFASDMVEIEIPGVQSINPSTAFRRPLFGGSTINQEIVFRVPAGLNLNDVSLLIRYYNYRAGIPLNSLR